MARGGDTGTSDSKDPGRTRRRKANKTLQRIEQKTHKSSSESVMEKDTTASSDEEEDDDVQNKQPETSNDAGDNIEVIPQRNKRKKWRTRNEPDGVENNEKMKS